MLILMYVAIVLYALFLPNKGILKFNHPKEKVRLYKSRFWIVCALSLSILSLTSKTYADVENYTVVFNLANSSGMSYSKLPDITPIWYILCKFFGIIGLNYRGMIIGTIFLSIGIMHKALNSLNSLGLMLDEKAFWGFFMLFPAVVQIVQMKFFLGTAIVFFSYQYLLDSTKKGTIKYIIGVLIATLIHSSCLIFIILIIVNYLKRSNIRKTAILTITLIALMGLGLKLLPKIASFFIADVRIERYFYSTTSKITFLAAMKVVFIWIAIVILASISVYRSWKIYKITENTVDLRSYNIALKYYMGLCLLGATLLMMYYDVNFFRFVEVGYLFGYVSMSIYWAKSRKMTIIKLLIAAIFIAVAAVAITTYAPFESVLKPLFSYEGIVKIWRE